ncbi:hypothetical protein ACRJ4W_26015 [Streptomyces sp. GLT-R25]
MARTERLGGPQKIQADGVRRGTPWSVGPPVDQELQFQVDESVVLEEGPDAGQSVRALGLHQIRMQQAEALVSGGAGRFHPFPQAQRAALVGLPGYGIARGGPTGGQQVFSTHTCFLFVTVSENPSGPPSRPFLCEAIPMILIHVDTATEDKSEPHTNQPGPG